MAIDKIKKFFIKNKYVFFWALVLAFLAGIFSWWQAGGCSASVTFFVSRAGTQQAADYKYDNYYALKAVDEFSESLSQWFENPEVVSLIYQKAGVAFQPSSLSGFGRVFKSIKTPSSNLVEVRFSAKNDEEAKKFAKAMSEVVQKKNSFILSASLEGVAFSITDSEPIIVKNTIFLWQSVLSGFLLGLATGIFFKAAKEYFK